MQAQGLTGCRGPGSGSTCGLVPAGVGVGTDAERVVGLAGECPGSAGAARGDSAATVVLLPFQSLYDDDAAVWRRCKRRRRGDGAPARPPEIVAAMGQLDLVVGMRMYSVVVAVAAGAPFVALSYVRR